jgi:hypothetical protein
MIQRNQTMEPAVKNFAKQSRKPAPLILSVCIAVKMAHFHQTRRMSAVPSLLPAVRKPMPALMGFIDSWSNNVLLPGISASR